MDDTRDVSGTDSDVQPGDGLVEAGEPRNVLMTRLAAVYEPRVLDWIRRVESATRDRD